MSKFKKGIFTTFALTASLLLTACGDDTETSNENGQNGGNSEETTTLTVAALEGSHLSTEMYDQVAQLFEEEHDGVEVEVIVSNKIEDEIMPQMQAGNFPDIIVLGQGSAAGLTETMIKERQIEPLNDLLEMNVYNEDITVGDKMIDGMVNNVNTNPHIDDEVILFPLFYSPIGFVYDQSVLDERNLDVPETMEEFLALDSELGEDIALFTFPSGGYFDSYFFAGPATIGGLDFYEKIVTFEEDIWLSDEATELLEYTETLLTEHTHEVTLANANATGYQANEQLVLDNEALFMLNGTWIVTQKEDAPKADNFEWGLMPFPAKNEGDTKYLHTGIETAWLPKEGDNIDLAKEFLAFSYSDPAVEIYMEHRQNPPVQGQVDNIYEPIRDFYRIYEQDNVEALVGGFATHPPVEGLNIQDTLYQATTDVLAGNLTVEEWQQEINRVSNRLGEERAKELNN